MHVPTPEHERLEVRDLRREQRVELRHEGDLRAPRERLARARELLLQPIAVIDGLSKAPMPSFLPPYSALFGDPEGLLCVQLSPAGSRDVNLVAMQLNVRLVARVRLPRPLTLYEIGRDYELGSYSDEADEIHVAAYRLRR